MTSDGVATMIWGQVSLADILSALEKRLMDPEVDPNFAEIVDLTEVFLRLLAAQLWCRIMTLFLDSFGCTRFYGKSKAKQGFVFFILSMRP